VTNSDYHPQINGVDLPTKIALGLKPRLTAAGWFGLAACGPIIVFFVLYGTKTNLDLDALWVLGVMPILVAAFFGFSLGSRILDPVYSMSVPRAALHGMGVALASYVVVACWYAANVSLTKYPPDSGFLLFAIMIGSITFVPIVAASGAGAGVLLCHFSCKSDFWAWLLNIPRITTTQATLLTVLAGSLVTLTGTVALFIRSSSIH
jgi:hypothetical protein